RIVIIGIAGRMGQALVRAASGTAAFQAAFRIVGAVASATSSVIGRDAGEIAGVARLGVAVSGDLQAALVNADVAVDFSRGGAPAANLLAGGKAGRVLVIGPTGHPPSLDVEFDSASHDIPLLVASNTSLAVTLLTEFVRTAARALPADEFDIEVLE